MVELDHVKINILSRTKQRTRRSCEKCEVWLKSSENVVDHDNAKMDAKKAKLGRQTVLPGRLWL